MIVCDRCFKAGSIVDVPQRGSALCNRCQADYQALVTAFLAGSEVNVGAPDVQAQPVASDATLTTVNVKADVTPQPMPVERAPII